MHNQPNRRIRTRMSGGVGGEEPRGSPLSRLLLPLARANASRQNPPHPRVSAGPLARTPGENSTQSIKVVPRETKSYGVKRTPKPGGMSC